VMGIKTDLYKVKSIEVKHKNFADFSLVTLVLIHNSHGMAASTEEKYTLEMYVDKDQSFESLQYQKPIKKSWWSDYKKWLRKGKGE
jgi:hypothetical protein